MSMPMVETSRPNLPGAASGREDAFWEAVRRRDRTQDGAFFFAVSTHWRLLPAELRIAAGEARERLVLCDCRGCAAGRLSRLQALPARPARRARSPGRGGAARLRTDRIGRGSALARGPRRERGFKPVPLPPRVQEGRGRHAEGLRRCGAGAARGRGLRTAETVTEAIYDAGFNSSSRFYETATARLGMTPTAVRRGGQGAVIRFAVGEASLGAVLVAATNKGVCAIMLGDDPDGWCATSGPLPARGAGGRRP